MLFNIKHGHFINNVYSLCKTKQVSRCYKVLSTNVTKNKYKHYPPANKEWNNSIYNYNSKNMTDLPLKDNMVKKLIKNYFNFVTKPKVVTKSARMRTFIRRTSTKGVFASKPEIKQTNDRAIITVYVFNRQKQIYKKKLLYIKKWLMESRVWTNASLNISKDVYKKKMLEKLNKKLFNNIWLYHRRIERKTRNPEFSLAMRILHSMKFRIKRRFLRKEISSYNLNNGYYSDMLKKSLCKKEYLIKNIFFFTFLKWALSIFRIKTVLFVPRNNKGIRIKHKKLKVFVKRGSNVKILLNKYEININNLNLLNLKLLMLLITNLEKISLASFEWTGTVNLLFSLFKTKYYKIFMKKYLRKELLGIIYLNRFYLDMYKYDKYLYFLKTFLKKIYNKKIEFNLVNHKYLHMNSDIFSEAISIKLKRKTGNALNILKRSTKLVKVPKIVEKKEAKKAILASRNNIFNGDFLHHLMHKIYALNSSLSKRPKKRSFLSSWNTKIGDVLGMIKYKWTTGVRIEVRGRLTKRYTASRAVYKFKYKGNLKNLDNITSNSDISSKSEELNKSPKLHMVRGEYRPNLQHTFTYANKRVGSFGIKGWISGN